MTALRIAMRGLPKRGRMVSVVGATLAVILLAVTGCSRSLSPMRLRKVLVDVAVGLEGIPAGGVSRETVREVVERTIARTETLERSDGRDGFVLRVLVEEHRASPSPSEGEARSLRLSVELRSEASPVGAEGLDLRAEAAVPWPQQSATGDDLSRVLEDAFGDALAQIIAAQGAAAHTDEVLVGWLGDDSTARLQRLEACRVLGARRAAAAATTFVNLLRDDDMELALLALRGLSALGAQAYADAIIDFSEGKSSAVRLHAIEALQENPGSRVRAWLFTLSTGHPEAQVRVAAERALAHVEQPAGDVEGLGLAASPHASQRP